MGASRVTVAAPPAPGTGIPHAADRGRARLPDASGRVERDGVGIAWERYGTGHPAILLLPTWSVIPARHWKLQVPFLARRFTVLVFDGRASGRSDRPIGPGAYADREFVADALAVLDAAGVERAVLAGLSMGAGYAVRLAAEHPDRALGAVLLGSSIPVIAAPPRPAGAPASAGFEDPPASDEGWDLYNAHHWRRDWPRFARFFAAELLPEPHSTKAREDIVEWMLDADPERIIEIERAPLFAGPPGAEPAGDGEGVAVPFVHRVRCPCLVVHGTDDRVVGSRHAARLAELLGAPLVAVEGGGHVPQARHPVLVNRLIAGFAAAVGSAAEEAAP